MERLFFECAIRAALLVAGTAIVLQALRVKDAAAKHKVWAGVVALMLVLPLWTTWGPKAPVRVLPPVAQRVSVVATAPAIRDVVPDVPQLEVNVPLAAAPAPPSPRWNWQELLLGVYLLGLGALLLRLAMGTVRAQRLVRRAVLLDGRLTSSACAAPVTTGWFRAKVILPEQWREWPQAKLDAVLAHEGEHARRRDPLVQGLALLNRAVFWFHPAAWWLEHRLSTLAEEACDDVVLARGHSPSDYSEYLMDMARAVMQSGARVNVAGLAMPGSSLPRRIKRIIDGAPVTRISRARMACVGLACTITCAAFAAGTLDHALLRAPMRSPQQQASGVPALPANLPTFESASVKVHNAGTDRFGSNIWIGVKSGLLTATNVTLRTLLQSAYPLTPAQGRMISGPPGEIDALRTRLLEAIPGAPVWIDSERFDVQAQAQGKPSAEQMRLMLQSLLAEQFKLAVHYKTDVVPVYALELVEAGRMGPQLRRHVNDGSCWDPAADQPPTSVTGIPTLPYCGGFRIIGPNSSIPENRRNVNMARVAAYLTQRLDRPVLDRTGLSGSYDFDLVIEHKPTPDYSKLFGAVQQQLGLRLVPTTGPVDTFVIDHVELPSQDGPPRPAASADQPAFQAASVSFKRNRSGDPQFISKLEPSGPYRGNNVPVWLLIHIAYQVTPPSNSSAAPEWRPLLAQRFDVEANVGGDVSKLRPMLQSLLAEGFKLAVHHETRQTPQAGPVDVLVIDHVEIPLADAPAQAQAFIPSTAAVPQPAGVSLPVAVFDASGRFVTGLRRNQFRVFEDGAEQNISSFTEISSFSVTDTPQYTIGYVPASSVANSAYRRPEVRLNLPTGYPQLKALTVLILQDSSPAPNSPTAVREEPSLATQAGATSTLSSSSPYSKWLNEDVVYIISADERAAFEKLSTDRERNTSIDQFWLRRDPTPATPKNEFQEEHYRRIAYVNEHFGTASDVGWRTDRGHRYIMWGPPTSKETHVQGDCSQRPLPQGGGDTNTKTCAWEKWNYNYVEGLGFDVSLEFVDREGTGDFRLTPETTVTPP